MAKRIISYAQILNIILTSHYQPLYSYTKDQLSQGRKLINLLSEYYLNGITTLMHIRNVPHRWVLRAYQFKLLQQDHSFSNQVPSEFSRIQPLAQMPSGLSPVIVTCTNAFGTQPGIITRTNAFGTQPGYNSSHKHLRDLARIQQLARMPSGLSPELATSSNALGTQPGYHPNIHAHINKS